MEKGSLLRTYVQRTFGSIRNLSRFLLEAFRTCLVGLDSLEATSRAVSASDPDFIVPTAP